MLPLFRRLLPLTTDAAASPGFGPAGTAPYLAGPMPGARAKRPHVSSRLRTSLRASSAEGVFAEIVGACAGGAAMTGWALSLGWSAFAIASLAALPFLAQVLQFPAAVLAKRHGRRRVALVAVTVGRQAVLPLVFLPFLVRAEAARLVLAAVAIVSAIAGVIANHAWVAWMGELVPGAIRGRYFGGRTARCTVAGSIAALIAGVVLDRTRAQGMPMIGLAALAAVASIAGLVTTVLMARQHDPTPPDPTVRLDRARIAGLRRSALSSLRDPRARPFLGYQLAWNAATGVSTGLLALHMLRDLGLGFAIVAAHGVATATARVLSGPRWGRVIDRRGAEIVLVACSFGLALSPVLWTAPPTLWFLPFVLDPLISGLLGSGHALSSFALPLTMGSNEDRPFHIASFATAGGLAYAAAAALGGTLATTSGVRAAFGAAAILRLCAASIALLLVRRRVVGLARST